MCSSDVYYFARASYTSLILARLTQKKNYISVFPGFTSAFHSEHIVCIFKALKYVSSKFKHNFLNHVYVLANAFRLFLL